MVHHGLGRSWPPGLAPHVPASTSEKEGLANQLLAQLRPHFLRRLKQSELASELPGISRKSHSAPLGASQSERYLEILRARRAGQIPALPALQRLLDTCAHPDLADGLISSHLEATDFPKASELLNILGNIARAGEKAIIFSNRRPIQDWLAALVRNNFGFEPAIINGEVSSSEMRMDLVERFSRHNGFRVLILGPRAAGVGLNITAANHVIHYTREWNPAIEAQATDRAYRMGQTKDVHVHTIVVGGAPWGATVEEKLGELLEKKQELIRRFVIPVEPVVINESELLDGT